MWRARGLLLAICLLVVCGEEGAPVDGSFHDQLAEERRLLEEQARPPVESQQQQQPQEHHEAPPAQEHQEAPPAHVDVEVAQSTESQPQEHHEAPPPAQEHHEAPPPPQEHHEAPPPPQEHHEAPPPPQEHHEAPPPPQEHHEAPPPAQEHHEAPPPPQEHHEAPPPPQEHHEPVVEHHEEQQQQHHEQQQQQQEHHDAPPPAQEHHEPAVEHHEEQQQEPLVLVRDEDAPPEPPQRPGRPNARPGPRSKTAPKRDAAAGAGYYEDDDYYGMNQNPADHIDTAAFQPSHTLSVEIPAGTVFELFEEVKTEDLGKVVRGDWFVTSGESLDLLVVITSPQGEELYREGPKRSASYDSWMGDEEPASEGSFHFYVSVEGVHRVALSNPSTSDARTVSFAWLLGKDDDDSYVDEWDPRTGEALDSSSKNATAFVVDTLMSRVSHVHKRIDEVIALQQFADVRFKRHLQTTESTNTRVLVWTLVETAFVLAVAAVQVLVIRRFDIKAAQPRSFV